MRNSTAPSLKGPQSEPLCRMRSRNQRREKRKKNAEAKKQPLRFSLFKSVMRLTDSAALCRDVSVRHLYSRIRTLLPVTATSAIMQPRKIGSIVLMV